MNWINRAWSTSLFLLLVVSCGSIKNTRQAVDTPLFQEDKTLYLQIEVTHTGKQYNFELKKKKTIPGQS
jgi:hypothetical protein